jgi:proteasome-associated ATPase
MPSRTAETKELLDRIIAETPADKPRLANLLYALKSEVEQLAADQATNKARIAELMQTCDALIQPANRIGTFLMWQQGSENALISMGDSEYVVACNPEINRENLTLGSRVLLNDAYAIVGAAPQIQVGAIVRVAEKPIEGRIRIGAESPGGEVRLAWIHPELDPASIAPGDEVRLDSSGKVAVELFKKSQVRDLFMEEIPETPWSAVGGQSEAIRVMRETVEHPLLFPDIYDQFGKSTIKGILLYGPPGCGKTLLGKALAYNVTKQYAERINADAREYFIAISGPKILNMWVGESERMVREIFATAREKAKEGFLVFIFVDEAESLLRVRSGGRMLNMSNTLVPQFCAELDGLQTLQNVVLILTSNRPDAIDPAILRPGRIDRKVKVNRPGKAESREILSIYLSENLPYDPELVATHDGEVACARKALVEGLLDAVFTKNDKTQVLEVAYRSGKTEILYQKDLISGAFWASVVDRAKLFAIRRKIEKTTMNVGISLADLLTARDEEFKENDIYPTTGALEEWLQLIDVKPGNVATLRPLGVFADRQDFVRPVI